MQTHYISFQIKNTASLPMFVSLKDPDGNTYMVGPLDQGEESIQVAPIGTTWSIQFGDPAAQEKGKSEEDMMRALFSDTRDTHGDARDTDGNARETDGHARETDGNARDTDGNARDTDGNARDTDGNARDTDGNARDTDGNARDTDAASG